MSKEEILCELERKIERWKKDEKVAKVWKDWTFGYVTGLRDFCIVDFLEADGILKKHGIIGA